MVERKLFVTLKVMSTRFVSPHSATTYPWRRIIPAAPPRGFVGPMTSLYGSRAKLRATISARSRGCVLSCARAKATAESTFAASMPTSAGARCSHTPRSG